MDEAAAQKIALEHAGVKAADATITKSKLDYEDGRQVYDIEWYAGGAKYDYEIAADTGEIISSAYAVSYTHLFPLFQNCDLHNSRVVNPKQD